MSDQLNIEKTRQHLFCHLDANKQQIQDLSEEELESVAGGIKVDKKFLAAGMVTGAVIPSFLKDMFAFQKSSAATTVAK